MADPKKDPKEQAAKVEAPPAPPAPPQYLVTLPPGAPVPGVGFVEVGRIFTGPPGYVPSLTFYGANESGVAEIVKAYKARAELLEKRLARAQARSKRGGSADDVEALLTQIEELEVELAKRTKAVASPTEPPKVREGFTMEQLAELNREADAATAGIVAKAAAAKEQRETSGGDRNL